MIKWLIQLICNHGDIFVHFDKKNNKMITECLKCGKKF